MNRLTGSKVFIPILSLVLAVLFLLPQIVSGATAPEAKKLLTLSGLSTPGLIAADSFGNTYIVDIYNNVIDIYNFKGTRTGTIKPSNKVSALAVSPDNLLYVGEVIGRSTDGLIEVFKTDGSPVRTIVNNVKLPGAMAFLSNGELYFISGYSVSKFDAAMNNISLQFGGKTGVQGSMVAPSSLAIREVKDPNVKDGIDRLKSEIYVLDYGQVSTMDISYGSSNYVWRVQVFDLNGTYLRSFSNYSFGVDGCVGSASGMALDKQGRVYVSDNVQNIVVVFDDHGLPLTTMSPIVNPINLYFTNDRLYVASKKSAESTRVGSADVFGIDSFASLAASPLDLKFAFHKGTTTASQAVSISNTGSASLSWQAAFTGAQGQWITLSQASGLVDGYASQAVTATINSATASGLAIGTYAGNLQLLSNGGTEIIPVTLVVVDAPVLTVSPKQFTVSKTAGDQIGPFDVRVTIANDTTGALDWTSDPDAQWLNIKKGTVTSSSENGLTTTVTAAQVVISADAVGNYTGTIRLSAAGATGSPSTITVTLEVTASNTINVTTNVADATFTITGPASFVSNGSGKNYSVGNLKPGDYTITYADIKGFIKPVSETHTLTSGEIKFAGDYTDLRRKVNIIASDAGGNKVMVFRADGSAVLNMQPVAGAIGVNTASGDIDGDGSSDIIIAPDNAVLDGAGRAAVVMGLDAEGAAISGMSFKAMSPAASGVSVATGDFDGDGKEEVVTGAAGSSTTVRVFTYNSGAVANTGIYFEAYPGNKGGVNVAAADLDGDGLAELITMPISVEIGTTPEVKVFRIDLSQGKAELLNSFNGSVDATECRFAVGDIDADGSPEIITVCAQDGAGSMVREYRASGELVRAFALDAGVRVNSVAAGDTDMDGTAEIILGDAPGIKMQSVRILDANTGKTIRTFRAFGSTGINVSVGNLGY